ncbi:hypothetical protein HanPI659440_Chr17g0661521 [Helianthus annuus]|nr:hypothetical protein HanPI659440_Chr17g0661521 [Helianthus annuus]
MTAAKDQVDKMKYRQSYRNLWHTDLMSTMAADTPYCCFALFWKRVIFVHDPDRR